MWSWALQLRTRPGFGYHEHIHKPFGIIKTTISWRAERLVASKQRFSPRNRFSDTVIPCPGQRGMFLFSISRTPRNLGLVKKLIHRRDRMKGPDMCGTIRLISDSSQGSIVKNFISGNNGSQCRKWDSCCADGNKYSVSVRCSRMHT
jgi:hypothetical protein